MTTWIDRSEAHMIEDEERVALVQRVEDLERRLADLEEWLGEVADDVLDREGVA